jgi:hypothetical protein
VLELAMGLAEATPQSSCSHSLRGSLAESRPINLHTDLQYGVCTSENPIKAIDFPIEHEVSFLRVGFLLHHQPC